MEKITTLEMEIAVSRFFDITTSVIVPNVYFGMFNHECDLIRLTKQGYCSEIEIKISRSDLLAEKKKKHDHTDKKIKYLYFALPWYLKKDVEHVPEKAGIIIVNKKRQCSLMRKPKMACNYKFSPEERTRLLELMAMRIWNLKKKLADKNGE